MEKFCWESIMFITLWLLKCLFTVRKPIKLFCLNQLLFLKIVIEKRSKEKCEIDGEYYTKYSGNPESLKKLTKQWKRSPINMLKGGEDVLRAFCKLFYLWFYVFSEQWKYTV